MEMARTSRKWIVPQGNGSYIMEMILHQGYGSRIKGNGSYLQGTGSHRECVVPSWKWIVTDGKELGQQSESQAPSSMSSRDYPRDYSLCIAL